MSTPSKTGRAMTPGRICAIYAFAFVLMLFLDAEWFSGFLERMSVVFEPAAVMGQWVDDVAEATGIKTFSEMEKRVAAELPELHVGAVKTVPDPAFSTVPPSSSSSSSSASLPAEDPSPLLPPVPHSAAPPLSPSSEQLSAPLDTPEIASQEAPPSVPAQTSEQSPPEETVPPQVESDSGAPDWGGPGQTAPQKAVREKPRVLLIGDSMMLEGFGPVLQRKLHRRSDMDVIREGKYSTGLSRQDYFDWHAHLRALLEEHHPDLVVICMGANDAQDIFDGTRRHHPDSKSWQGVYRSRAERLLTIARSKGAKVVWVGLPIMSKEPYATRIRRLSDLQKQACEACNVPFVDTVRTLADARGKYTTFAEDSRGRHTRLRYKDMVHVTEAGGAMLAAVVEPVVEQELGLGKVVASPPGIGKQRDASDGSLEKNCP